MANRLVCSTRDSTPLAVWTAAPGEHRSVGARQVPAGPGTDELRCAGPWEDRVLRQPAVIAAGPPRPLLVWRVVVRCLVPCSPAWSPGAGLAAGWPRPPGGRGHPGAQPLWDQRPRPYAGSALRAVRWC